MARWVAHVPWCGLERNMSRCPLLTSLATIEVSSRWDY